MNGIAAIWGCVYAGPGGCATEVAGDLAASIVVAAAVLAATTATPPSGRRRRRRRLVASHAPLPAVQGRVVVPAPFPPRLLSVEGVSPPPPPRALVGLGDQVNQDKMGAWNEQDSMNKHTLLLSFFSLRCPPPFRSVVLYHCRRCLPRRWACEFPQGFTAPYCC